MPVGAYPYAPVPPPPPVHHHVNQKWIIIPIVLLIAILATALIVTALVFTPVHPFSLGHTDSVNQPDINILNLNFQADIAQVNIMAQNATGDDIVIYTSASGSTGAGNSNIPVQISFSNQTVGNTLTVNSKVVHVRHFWDSGKGNL